MKKFLRHSIPIIVFGCAAVSSAFADVMINFTTLPTNTENYTYNGFVSGTIDGVPFNDLICDDRWHTTYVPSGPWDYHVSTLNSLTFARFVAAPGAPTAGEILNYEIAAILINNLIGDPGQVASYQYALWHLFSPSSDLYGNSSTLLLNAQTAANDSNVDRSDLYSRLRVYTPADGVSQEFLQLTPPSSVPEPGSVILLATILILIGLLMRRRLRRVETQ